MTTDNRVWSLSNSQLYWEGLNPSKRDHSQFSEHKKAPVRLWSHDSLGHVLALPLKDPGHMAAGKTNQMFPRETQQMWGKSKANVHKTAVFLGLFSLKKKICVHKCILYQLWHTGCGAVTRLHPQKGCQKPHNLTILRCSRETSPRTAWQTEVLTQLNRDAIHHSFIH